MRQRATDQPLRRGLTERADVRERRPDRRVRARLSGRWSTAQQSRFDPIDSRPSCIFMHRQTWGECPHLPHSARRFRGSAFTRSQAVSAETPPHPLSPRTGVVLSHPNWGSLASARYIARCLTEMRHLHHLPGRTAPTDCGSLRTCLMIADFLMATDSREDRRRRLSRILEAPQVGALAMSHLQRDRTRVERGGCARTLGPCRLVS
jgi:hypothetical protein